jgi:hypothetical protein
MSKMSELFIHLGVEVVNEEVGPKLIQNIHVEGAVTGGSCVTLLKRLGSKSGIKFIGRVVRKMFEFDGVVLALYPIRARRALA